MNSLSKLNDASIIDAIKSEPAKQTKGKKKVYPVIDSPEYRALVDKAVTLNDALKKGTREIAVIKETLSPIAIDTWANQTGEYTGTYILKGTKLEGKVSFKDQYTAKVVDATSADPKTAEITEEIHVLADELDDEFDDLFDVQARVAINVQAIPEDKLTDVVSGLIDIMIKAGINPDDVITRNNTVVPKPGLNEKRVHLRGPVRDMVDRIFPPVCQFVF